MDHADKKPDFAPEDWLVTWFNHFKIDQERAQKFRDMRLRLCEQLGSKNEACRLNNLLTEAMDLLLAHEEEYLKRKLGEKLP